MNTEQDSIDELKTKIGRALAMLKADIERLLTRSGQTGTVVQLRRGRFRELDAALNALFGLLESRKPRK